MHFVNEYYIFYTVDYLLNLFRLPPQALSQARHFQIGNIYIFKIPKLAEGQKILDSQIDKSPQAQSGSHICKYAANVHSMAADIFSSAWVSCVGKLSKLIRLLFFWQITKTVKKTSQWFIFKSRITILLILIVKFQCHSVENAKRIKYNTLNYK